MAATACLASAELMFRAFERSRSVQVPSVCLRKLRSSAAGNRGTILSACPAYGFVRSNYGIHRMDNDNRPRYVRLETVGGRNGAFSFLARFNRKSTSPHRALSFLVPAEASTKSFW